ncbi:MAG: hypothetical protein H6732_06670 [Alphaproteobacteria bacterium]|nr:hypothetical protein [Alphaproteobacteria bacterium]
MPDLFDDVVELLDGLEREGVSYLIVGAFALAVHGVERFTHDFDVVILPGPENAERAWTALAAWGAPLRTHGVTPADLARPGNVYQLGLPPRRIDVLNQISGVDLADAAPRALHAHFAGGLRPFLSVQDLVRNKRASGRTKDLLDLELLREAGVDVDGVDAG